MYVFLVGTPPPLSLPLIINILDPLYHSGSARVNPSILQFSPEIRRAQSVSSDDDCLSYECEPILLVTKLSLQSWGSASRLIPRTPDQCWLNDFLEFGSALIESTQNQSAVVY